MVDRTSKIVKITAADQVVIPGVGGKRIQVVDWAVILSPAVGVPTLSYFYFGDNDTEGEPFAAVLFPGGTQDCWTARWFGYSGALSSLVYPIDLLLSEVGESIGFYMDSGGTAPLTGSFIRYREV